MQKVNPADQPILFSSSLNSASLLVTAVDEYAETLIAPRDLHHQRRGAGDMSGPVEVRRARAAGSQQAG